MTDDYKDFTPQVEKLETRRKEEAGSGRFLTPFTVSRRKCRYLRVAIPTDPSASKRFFQLASRIGGIGSAAATGLEIYFHARLGLLLVTIAYSKIGLR
jgi:hypothetical protein